MSKESIEGQIPTATSSNDPHHATSSQDQHPEDGDAVAHDIFAHYWMSKKSASSANFTQWLMDNREDRALHVSLYPKAVITQHKGLCMIRTFDVACLITCWHVFKVNHTPVMNMSSLIQIATLSS